MQVKSGGPLHTPWPQSSRHLKNHGGGGGELVGAESSKHPTISTHCNTLSLAAASSHGPVLCK